MAMMLGALYKALRNRRSECDGAAEEVAATVAPAAMIRGSPVQALSA